MIKRRISVSLLVLLLVMVSQITLSGVQGADYGVSLECSLTERYTTKNIAAVFPITITNTGTAADTFTLSMNQGPDKWKIGLSPESVLLQPGESQDITLSVNPICGCVYSATAYINVTAASNSDPSVVDILETRTTYVTTGAKLSSDEASAKIERNTIHAFSINIENECTLEDDYSIEVKYPEDISAKVETDFISLAGKGSTSFDVMVSVLATTTDGLYDVEVTAASIRDPTKSTNLTLVAGVGDVEVPGGGATSEPTGDSGDTGGDDEGDPGSTEGDTEGTGGTGEDVGSDVVPWYRNTYFVLGAAGAAIAVLITVVIIKISSSKTISKEEFERDKKGKKKRGRRRR